MIRHSFISTTLASLLLIGCGSTDTTTSASTGYFVDSAVQNLDYDCIADEDFNKTTTLDGAFSCQNMTQVQFRIGNLILGEISSLPADGFVMPQDLVNVDRTDIYNERVTEIARLLQSYDSDGDPTNGITIGNITKDALRVNLDINTTFDANSTNLYLQMTNQATIMTQTQAREHLNATLQSMQTNVTTTDTDSAEVLEPESTTDTTTIGQYGPSNMTDITVGQYGTTGIIDINAS